MTPMKAISLETGSLRLEFSTANGALVRMEAPETGWTIHRRPELGLSWRLLVPVDEEHRDNPVFGEKQTLTSFEADAESVRLVWDGVESERAGRLDIRVVAEVRREGRQAVWRTRIENRGPYFVENVYSPYIGDLSHPHGAPWFAGLTYSYASARQLNIWPHFNNTEGDHSVDFPTQFPWGADSGASPASPWFLLRSPSQGLYAGVKSDRGEIVAWHAELRPGYDSAIDGRVPDADEIAGKPVHIRFAAVHVPYIRPGDSADLTPIALEAYSGGWQEGVDIYKRWLATWSKPVVPPAWAREPHAWWQLHVNSPEDELRLRFTELPKVAEEAAKYGIRAIQLVGWNDGGQDQGNPSHTPDPRLGTFEELKEAIAKCQALGVRIVLFAKFTWADRATDWYRGELVKYAVKDPYGDAVYHGGYEYQTATQLMGINPKRFSLMCFDCPEYLEICRGEFRKLLDLGAAGMLYDECQHHAGAYACFDTSHGHRYGQPVFQHDREFLDMLRATDGRPTDFLMAGEACYDWELETYDLSYFRSRDKGHVAASRYMRPKALLMTAVSGFNDRNMIDQCLMCRYIISYEPYNFKGWPHDFPDTMAYGRKMDALRTKYRKWLWDGEYRDTCGARVVRQDGSAHAPYARFEAGDGTSALVICNYGDAPVTVTASLDSGDGLGAYRTVDEDVWFPSAGGIGIPGRSAVVVLPAGAEH